MYTIQHPEHLFNLLEQQISDIKFGQSPDTLYQPIDYFMKMGGKRMRPLLTLLACQLYQPADEPQVLQAALALEVFHNFTLMHDDIMDKAPLRRGFETVHTRWDANVAILAGDVMMSHSFEMMAQSLPQTRLRHGCVGFCHMARMVCEGQQMDMDMENNAQMPSKADYIQMITLKTAVLPAFALQLGAILAQKSSQTEQILYDFGVNIGIGFQIMDDWLDVFGDPNKTGKQSGGDILANKKTYLLVEAMQAASPEQKNIIQKTIQDKNCPASQKVHIIKQLYTDTGAEQNTLNAAKSYYQKAFETLEQLKSEETSPAAWLMLNEFVKQTLIRDK